MDKVRNEEIFRKAAWNMKGAGEQNGSESIEMVWIPGENG